MPDPHSLKIGDQICFIAIPEEWSQPGYTVHKESIAFLKAMIRRARPSRVARLDAYGQPWIEARIRQRGKLHYHRLARCQAASSILQISH